MTIARMLAGLMLLGGVAAATQAHHAATGRRTVTATVAPPRAAPPLAEAAAPQFSPADEIEPRVTTMLEEKCPRRLIAKTANDQILVDFDGSFRPLLIPTASPSDLQVALEAYRRCIDRAIAAIGSSYRHTLADPSPDANCLDCTIAMAELGAELPRLREIKGLTYLMAPRLRDQEPIAAVRYIRDAVDEFGTSQAAYRSEASDILRDRSNALNERKYQAIRQANKQTMISTLSGLAIAGIGMASGMSNQQAAQMGQQAIMQQYDATNAQLTSVSARIESQKADITGVEEALFAAPIDGQWHDDGIRVTVPRLLTNELIAGKRDLAGTTGALTDLIHLRMLVHIQLKLANGTGFCTGSIVAPRLILTNRHCVEDLQTGERFRPEQFTVRWEYHDAANVGLRRTADRYAVRQVVTTDGPLDGTRHLNDWAFLVLAKSTGNKGLAIVDPSARSDRTQMRIAVAGYSADLNEGSEITMDWGCRALWLPNGQIVHRCRTFHGASGSPIIAVDGSFGRMMIVGVHAATSVADVAGPGEATGPIPPAVNKFGTGTGEMFSTYRDLKRQLSD
jgi:V8-like Glu-specific endopeptidase